MTTRRLLVTLSATAVLTVALGSAAVADPVDLSDGSAAIPVANVVWEIGNWGGDYGYSTTEASTFAADVDPADPWLVDPVNDDAVDGVFTVAVDGAFYGSAACDGEGACDYTVDVSPAGGDTVVTAPTEVMSTLQVGVQQRFYAVGDIARTLVTFTNPTAAPVTVDVDVLSDYGSDWDTTVEADSTGDENVTTADRWFVTGGDSDPVVTTVWAGPAPTLTPVDAMLGDVRYDYGDESIVSYELTVAPGATVHLAYFVGVRGWNAAPMEPSGLQGTVPIAADYAAAVMASTTATAEFATFGGRLTAGLPVGASVLNWGTVSAAPAADPATPVVTAPAFTG